jgi:predicted Zn-dependent protease
MPHILSYVLIGLIGLLSVALDPALAAGTEDTAVEAELAPDYTAAKALIEAQDFAGALPLLDALVVAEPGNADAWNLHGFANRKLGNMEVAAKSYDTALTLNPAHLGALEYQGEMFLETGKVDAAITNLAKLKGLCGECEQAEDLAAAIGAAS